VREAVRDDLDPALELLLATGPDLDSFGYEAFMPSGQREAKHVLIGHEPVSALRQHGADGWISQVGQLHLHGRAQGGEFLLDFIEQGVIRYTAETEPGDLVERGRLLGERGHASHDGFQETRTPSITAMRSCAPIRDELHFGPLDSLSQAYVAKKRLSSRIHRGRVHGRTIQPHLFLPSGINREEQICDTYPKESGPWVFGGV
jgi:hypothetical protein